MKNVRKVRFRQKRSAIIFYVFQLSAGTGYQGKYNIQKIQMLRTMILIFLVALVVQSKDLSTFNYGPYNEPFDYVNKYLIGDVKVGDKIRIELEFPFGSQEGVHPDEYVPKIYDAATKTATFDPEFWSSRTIPLGREDKTTLEWTVGNGQNGLKYFVIEVFQIKEYIQFYVVISKINAGGPEILHRYVDIMRTSRDATVFKMIKLYYSDRLSIEFRSSTELFYYFYKIQYFVRLKEVGNHVSVGSSLVTVNAFSAGTYLLQIQKITGFGHPAGSYQSDAFLCHFPSIYQDVNNVFQACYNRPLNTFSQSISPNTSHDSRPYFQLGALKRHDVIKMSLSFSTRSVRTFKLRLLNADRSPVKIQPAPFDRDIENVYQFFETFWTVPVHGRYILEVQSSDPAVGEDLCWYQLTVWDANSDTAILKEVDLLRSMDTIYHLVSTKYNRTLIALTHDRGADKIDVFNLETTFPIILGSVLTEQSQEGNTKSYKLKSGNYLAAFRIDQPSSIRYQSDEVLPCFTSSDYSDSKGIFQACKASASPSPRSLKLPGNFPASRPKIYGDSLIQLTDNTGTQAVHKLDFFGKNLKKDEWLQIRVNFPRPTGKNPSTFILTLLDLNRQPITPQPYPFGQLLKVNPYFQYFYFYNWVDKQEGQYYIRVDQGDSSQPEAFVIYNIQVRVVQQGRGIYTIVEESDILRPNNHIFHLVELKSRGSIRLGNTLGNSNSFLYRMDPDNNLVFQQRLPWFSLDNFSNTFDNLSPGFYGVGFKYDPNGEAGSTFYASSAYTCPNPLPFYKDSRGIFQPCVKQEQPRGPCAKNYEVKSGRCMKCNGPSPSFPCKSCPQRYFINPEGLCEPIDSECKDFYPESGECRNCYSGAKPVNGICCPSGQEVSGSRCVSAGGAVNLRKGQ